MPMKGDEHNVQPRIITPLDALELEWSIIPCNKHKIPLLTSWKEYQTRRPTRAEIEKWINWKPAAWALIAGAVSRRIVLDFDGEPGRRTLEALALNPHRRTPSGGYHVDIAAPAWRVPTLNAKIKTDLNEKWPGLDIRGEGGYALFAGRTDNGEYQWLRPPDTDPMPAALIEFLKPAEICSSAGARSYSPAHAELIAKALARAGQGRNAAGFWLAAQLRDNGYTQETAAEVMQEYRRRCPETNSKGEAEEYTEDEALASLEQAYRKPARGPWKTGAPAELNGTGPADETRTKSTSQAHTAEPHKSQFACTPTAVFHIAEEDPETGEPKKTFVCSRLEVTAYARDLNSESWGRCLKWTDTAGREHTWIAPMRMLAGDGIAFRETLADGGLEIGYGPKTNTLLTQYVRSERPLHSMYCVPYVGWCEHAFVFPECTIPGDAEVGYQSAGRGEHFYRSRGTLENWQQRVSRKCAGNSRLVFAVSAAFAGPLMRTLGVQGGGFHFCGTSSTGKSTTQWVAGSVWGGGGRNGFARTWSATKNALESTAELHNDGILILDEIRMIDPKEVEQIVYMLANGSGKARETRNLTGRRTLQWLCMILSSGEIPLADCAALAGTKIKGGAEIRMVTIPAEAGAGMGIFEQLHDTDDPREFAESLEAESKENYGTAIREYLECLLTNWETAKEEVQQFISDFIADNLPAGAAPEIRRVLRRFALCAAAGELATDHSITGWQEGEAEAAARQCFDAWLELRGGIEPTDVINAMLQIRGIIAQEHSRFRPAEPDLAKDGPDRTPRALGYWKRIKDELIYLVDQDSFRKELCAGFEPRTVLEELRRRHYLHLNETRDRYTTRQEVTLPSGDTGRFRFYGIRSAILNFLGDEIPENNGTAGQT